MADVFSSLIFTCSLGTSFSGRFIYETGTPRRKHSLVVYFTVSSEPTSPPTVSVLFELLKEKFVMPLSSLQSNEVRWTTLDLTVLDEVNAPSGLIYHKRYSGVYGSQKLGRVNPDKAFRFELRSMSADWPERRSTLLDSIAIEQSYSQRLINLRGVPDSFEFYDRDNLNHQSQVDDISNLLVGEMSDSTNNLKLRVRMPVAKPSQPVRLQSIVLADPIGLVLSPLSGKKRIG